jgi:signal transduction histidine kinase
LSAERAGELTKQLLGFACKGKYLVEPLSLNNVVRGVFKIISRTFDRAIEVKTTLQEGLWTVEGDRNQLEHVILNLCLNARDAMPAGGVLSIETLNMVMREGDLSKSPSVFPRSPKR